MTAFTSNRFNAGRFSAGKFSVVGDVISVIISGLTNGIALVGSHASITMSVSEGTITARKWGSTNGGSEYGTGTNPTDFTAGNGGVLYATATVDGEDYTSSTLIQYTAPTADSTIADQDFLKDEAEATVVADVTSLFTGTAITYGVSGYAGASLDGNALKIDPTTATAATEVTLTATNSGGSASISFNLDVTELVFSVAPSITGSGKIGGEHTVTATANVAGGTYSYDWRRDGVTLGAADLDAYTAVAGDDETNLDCEVTYTKDGVSVVADSNDIAITYNAPVAAGTLNDPSYPQDTAISAFDISADFTGSDITYSLAPSSNPLPAGLSISSGGSLTGTPTASAAPVVVTFRGTNSGGFDETSITITITDAPVLISSSDPADNDTNHPAGDPIVITFNKDIAFGTGTIVIRELDGSWTNLEVINVS